MKRFKKGDKVKVINPDFFVRCGYPETVESAEKKLEEWFKKEYGESLFIFLQKKFPFLSKNVGPDLIDWDSYGTRKIISFVAREYNKNALKFGGTERRVYTKHDSRYKDKICEIVSEKPIIKKSGVYRHGYSSNYLEGEYEPPYLDNVKTHVFYEIKKNIFDVDMWIESCNIEHHES